MDRWTVSHFLSLGLCVLAAILSGPVPAAHCLEGDVDRDGRITGQDASRALEILSGRPAAGASFTNTAGMTFRLVPAGTFTMGSPAGEPGRGEDEPQHSVTLSRAFYMQTTEVTQGQWRAVMGTDPSYFSACGDNCPVENISWNDAQAFIQNLNQMEGTDRYRLPTEAEWEYAARSGTTTALSSGALPQTGCVSAPNLQLVGWYCYNPDLPDNLEIQSHPVAGKQANAWGLYDMHGNVWEWCLDRYGTYPSQPVTDPTGPAAGMDRIYRGGAWSGDAWMCRSAERDRGLPDVKAGDLGFRVVREP